MRKLYVLPLSGRLMRHDGVYVAIEYGILPAMIIASIYSSGHHTFNDPDDLEAVMLEEVYSTLYDKMGSLPSDVQDIQYNAIVSYYTLLCKHYYGLRPTFCELIENGWDVHSVDVSLKRECCMVTMHKVSEGGYCDLYF